MKENKKITGSWTVVEFLRDNNSVEAVPTIWLGENSTCYWPMFDKNRISSAIQNCEPVCRTSNLWQSFDVKLFKNATYNDYKQARLKCKKAEDTSDLESASSSNKRISKKRRSSTSTDSEIEEKQNKKHSNYNIQSKNTTLPALPKITFPAENNSQAKIVDYYPECNTTENSHEQISQIGEISNYTPSKRGSTSEHNSSEIINRTISPEKKRNKHNNKNTSEYYFKQLLRKFNSLENNVELKLSELTKAIKEHRNGGSGNNDDINGIWDKFDLPLRTEANLQIFEDYLRNEENMAKSIKLLSRLGGSNEEDFVRRALRKLITDEVQEQYSWAGQKKKKNFSSLQIYDLIFKTAMSSLQNDPKEKFLENAFKGYLKRATERLKKFKQ